jgi:hypothetical protein
LTRTAEDDALLTAVADHLRMPLLQIARLAELGNRHALPRISLVSEQALRLIDAYVMTQNQLELELEPVFAGAVMADVAYQLEDFARDAGYSIVIDQASPTSPVMGHRETLKTILLLLGTSIIEAGVERETVDRRLVFGIHRSAKGIVVGAFHSSLELTQDVINLTRQLHGRASQAAPALGASGAAGLAIADNLSQILEAPLRSYRHKTLTGIGSLLQPTTQLQLL